MRRSISIRSVAAGGVIRNISIEEIGETGLRRSFTGSPCRAQSLRPIWMLRLELPTSEVVACETSDAVQSFWSQQRRWRMATAAQAIPERREHAQTVTLLVADGGGFRQKIAVGDARGDTDVIQCADNIVADRAVRRGRDIVPCDAIRTGLAREISDHLRGRALPQQEGASQRRNIRLQGANRLRQPPTRSAAQRSPLR